MAAFARGKLVLQDVHSISHIGLPGAQRISPFPLNRATLIRPQVRPITTKRTTPIMVSSGPFQTTRIMPTLELSLSHKKEYSQESIPQEIKTGEKPRVLLPKEVDFAKIRFGEPTKSLKTPRVFIPIYYATENTKLRIQTPALRVPFTIDWQSELAATQGVAVTLSLATTENDQFVNQFAEFLTKLDEAVLEEAKKNASTWFPGKNFNAEVIQFQYKPLVRPSKDNKYPPNMRVKVGFRDGKPKANFIGPDGQPISPQEGVAQRSRVKGIFEIGTVWFAAGGFGISMKGLSFKVVELPSKKIEFREETQTQA